VRNPSLLLLVLPALVAAGGAGSAELIGYAALPSESYATGQPVQGVSAIAPAGTPRTWWALSDNGYGTRDNSANYRLTIYLFELDPRRSPADTRAIDDARVRLTRQISLRDPQRLLSFPITLDQRPGRPLTGADIDPESMVADRDGSFWIGDEFGPWLLHFDRTGVLLAPPWRATPLEEQRSPQNPQVLAKRAQATIRGSKGFEGLAYDPKGRRLLAMLEGPVAGDRDEELRIYEFDLATQRFTERYWRYALDAPAHAIGDIADDGAGGFLVIERDELEGNEAKFKRIFRIALPERPSVAPVAKELVADLLDIADPRGLGGPPGTFRFPFWCIESVQAIDRDTMLVVNDNNYPDKGGRGPEIRDRTEWIWLRIGAARR
jgi:glycerophosphoryl diester phosphodiesterase